MTMTMTMTMTTTIFSAFQRNDQLCIRQRILPVATWSIIVIALLQDDYLWIYIITITVHVFRCRGITKPDSFSDLFYRKEIAHTSILVSDYNSKQFKKLFLFQFGVQIYFRLKRVLYLILYEPESHDGNGNFWVKSRISFYSSFSGAIPGVTSFRNGGGTRLLSLHWFE